jgi:hypothetical protein
VGTLCRGALLLVVLAGNACASGEQTSLEAGFAPEGAAPIGSCPLCNDNNSCTKDICLVGGGCRYDRLSAGSACDDQDACTVDDQCDAAGTCQGRVASDPVYRYHHLGNGAYYYTRGGSGPAGFAFERKVFRVLQGGLSGTVPLIRKLSPSYNEFMLVLDPAEGSSCCGYQDNGTLGYIFKTAQPHTVPLHRLLKGTGTAARHLSTLDPQEGTGDGFAYEVQQGYVCP